MQVVEFVVLLSILFVMPLRAEEAPIGAIQENRYRGVNVVLEHMAETDIYDLAVHWNANIVRVCLGMVERGLFTFSNSEPIQIGEADFHALDTFLEWCERYGIRVIICLQMFPGQTNLSGEWDNSLWTSFAHHDRLVEFWRQMAAHYASFGSVIWGYDLLNEPHPQRQIKGTPSDWNLLAKRLTAAIREYDQTHAIVVEGLGWKGTQSYLELEPTGDPNTIYSFHLWDEWGNFFASQGIYTFSRHLRYPREGYDRDYLERRLLPILRFRKTYSVPILVGEFGVVCWAPPESRVRYLRDCMEIFENHGFDYLYWSFREIPAWSLEHDVNAQFVGKTDALDVFLDFLARNELAPHLAVGKPSAPVAEHLLIRSECSCAEVARAIPISLLPREMDGPWIMLPDDADDPAECAIGLGDDPKCWRAHLFLKWFGGKANANVYIGNISLTENTYITLVLSADRPMYVYVTLGLSGEKEGGYDVLWYDMPLEVTEQSIKYVLRVEGFFHTYWSRAQNSFSWSNVNDITLHCSSESGELRVYCLTLCQPRGSSGSSGSGLAIQQ